MTCSLYLGICCLFPSYYIMSSSSNVYTSYQTSFSGSHTTPPPPPPKPSAQETNFANTSLESQSNTPTTIKERSINYTRATHVHTQPAEYGQLQGIVHPPQSQDPGERWLPKILENKSFVAPSLMKLMNLL